jgi:hypothetical protein
MSQMPNRNEMKIISENCFNPIEGGTPHSHPARLALSADTDSDESDPSDSLDEGIDHAIEAVLAKDVELDEEQKHYNPFVLVRWEDIRKY